MSTARDPFPPPADGNAAELRAAELRAAGLRYVEAPQEYIGPGPHLYLAGGITGCPDWQAEAVALLADAPIVLFNPRRRNFRVADRDAAATQVRWEYQHLRRASLVLFWFTEGASPQPIALYELGALAAGDKPLVVGAHPDYIRRIDVVLQLALARPGLAVHSDLATTLAVAVAHLDSH